MKVLFVSSEAAPFKKFGGLGDYSGSLPKALEKENVEVDLILPYYDDAKFEGLKVFEALTLFVPFNNDSIEVTYMKTKLPGSDVDVLMPRHKLTFSGDFLSDAEFYALFNKCVVEYIKARYNTYTVIHCNDWHTGFIVHLLEDELGKERPKTLLTIHNLGYQGVSSATIVKKLGFVPGEHQLLDYDMSDGNVNMLFQGITSADYLNTVSESYAKELQTKEFGGVFTDIFKQKAHRFSGILNGIDYTTLPRDFDLTNWQQAVPQHKKEIQEELGLQVGGRPLFSFISRLDPGQKGLDVLFDALDTIFSAGGQFILLGTGDPIWEGKFKELSEKYKNNDISINIMFDVKLAQRIYQGSDFFFVPSKYEPCGLTQMMAMWYGVLPIVHAVGGLKDTVVNMENGFTYEDHTSKALSSSIGDALKVYKDKKTMKSMIEAALKSDFSWDKSAKLYKNLYYKLHE